MALVMGSGMGSVFVGVLRNPYCADRSVWTDETERADAGVSGAADKTYCGVSDRLRLSHSRSVLSASLTLSPASSAVDKREGVLCRLEPGSQT